MSIDRLGKADGDLFTRRPFQVTWFASQESMWVPLTAGISFDWIWKQMSFPVGE